MTVIDGYGATLDRETGKWAIYSVPGNVLIGVEVDDIEVCARVVSALYNQIKHPDITVNYFLEADPDSDGLSIKKWVDIKTSKGTGSSGLPYRGSDPLEGTVTLLDRRSSLDP